MGIAPEHAAATANLLEAVANTSLFEAETPVLDRFENVDGDPVSDSAMRDGVDGAARWDRTIDGAANLQEAAQWLIYLDPERARSVMQRAGLLYYRFLGHAYGVYLMVVAGSATQMLDSSEFDQLITHLEITSGIARDGSGQYPDVRSAEDPPVPPAMWHPQQQAYGLLATAGEPRMAEQFSSRIHSLATSSPHLRGVAPVGATGTPLSTVWEIAKLLTDDGDEAVGRLVVHLTLMAERYDQAMRLARVNDYLWTHCLAPVDVADMELIGITTLAIRRFGPSVHDLLAERLRTLGPLTRAAVDIGRWFA